MSQSKHTPAPWVILQSENGLDPSHTSHKIINSDEGGNFICLIGGKGYEVSNANARLISAAPEMLAALERWQNEWVVNGTPEQHANNYSIEIQINDAINKAKGI